MENKAGPGRNDDLQDLFLEMMENQDTKELLLMILNTNNEQEIYEMILQKIKGAKND